MRICPQCGSRSDATICARDGFPTVVEGLFAGPDTAPALVGRRFGDRYQVEELIGHGGMGWVFQATHLVMQQSVALKIMRRDVARDLSAVKRFSKEARDCSRLRHHNTIKVYDFGVSDDGYPYIVMEYLEGQPLSRVLRADGALPFDRAVHIATQICASLDEAHDIGLVHRDLKPANVFLTRVHHETDYVKVLDFGIAKTVRGDTGDALTQSGMVIGTPKYLSPEQAQSRRLDRRSDLYSLGVMLYEMLLGEAPFQAPSTGALLAKQIYEPPPRLPDCVAGRPLPEGVAGLVAQLLEKDPARRLASAREVADRLVSLRDGGTVTTLPYATAPATPPTAVLDGGGGRPGAGADPDPSGTQPTPDPTGLEPTGPRGRGQRGVTARGPAPRRARGTWFASVGVAVVVAAAVVALSLAPPNEGADPPAPGGNASLAAEAGASATGQPGVSAEAQHGPPTDAPGTPVESRPGAAPTSEAPTNPDPSLSIAMAAAAEDGEDPASAEDPPEETAAVEAAGESAPARPAPAPVTVRLVTEPRRVVVAEGDAVLARRTPIELVLAPGAARTVEVRRKGYETTRVRLTADDGAEREVRLVRTTVGRPARAAGERSSAPPPARPPRPTTYEVPPL